MPQNTSYITYLPFRVHTNRAPQYLIHNLSALQKVHTDGAPKYLKPNPSPLSKAKKVDVYLAPPYLFVVCLPLLPSAGLEASSLAECAASKATSGISSSAACSDSDLVLGRADWLGVSAMDAEEDVEVL